MINQVKVFLSVALMTISIYVQAEQASAKLLPNDSENLITIPAHSRSAEVNAKHAAECAAMGGVDITDDVTIHGGGVTDSVICQITDKNKMIHQAISKQANKTLATSMMMKSLQAGGLVTAYAPNGYYDSKTYIVEAITTVRGNGINTLIAVAGFDVPGDYFYSGDICRGYYTDMGRGGLYLGANDSITTVWKASCYASPGVHTSDAYAYLLDNGVVYEKVKNYGTIIHPNAPGTVDISKNKGNDNSPNCALPSSLERRYLEVIECNSM